MTAALEGGEWSAARPGRTLPQGKKRYPFYRWLGGPQGRCGRAENLIPTGIRSRTVQPVVSCHTDWATQPTCIYIYTHTQKGLLLLLLLLLLHIKKVKWSRYRPGLAQRVGRGIALLFHNHGSRRGWVVSNRPRPNVTPGKDPVPFLQEAGWAPEPVWTCGKSHSHRDSIADRPARSQSLYRLSYRAHCLR